ncbi:polysaccharide deacetylase family protein [Lysinibacillus xylanilyticus]|uniref:polysaccharide deacetylase family protein n=1 Tax=Lysinibacillus xylanilyticus TaxID=582475 RepID=UPI0038119891
MLKKIVKAGHQIRNHSYLHKRMVFKGTSFTKKNQKSNKLIKSISYTETPPVRAVYGKKQIGLLY